MTTRHVTLQVSRPCLAAAAGVFTILLTLGGPAAAQTLAAPVLRAEVTVASTLVRIGDVVDNAGQAAEIAIFRAPDPGTTGSVPTAQVISALRNHQVIGVDTRQLAEISVTRIARTVSTKEIEEKVAAALSRVNGLGDAKDLTITFDRDLRALQLDAANRNDLKLVHAKYTPYTGRFDVAFEIFSDGGSPLPLRFTGSVTETVEATITTRAVERGDILKSADLIIRRVPKSEAATESIARDHAVGMAAQRPLRANQTVRLADLMRPDLVSRDQTVTLIYQTAGVFLTTQGKALEAGSEGDSVNVMNIQSKRTVRGIITGPAQVTISATINARVNAGTTTLASSEPPAAPRRATPSQAQ